jgi:hypothetical protein
MRMKNAQTMENHRLGLSGIFFFSFATNARNAQVKGSNAHENGPNDGFPLFGPLGICFFLSFVNLLLTNVLYYISSAIFATNIRDKHEKWPK